MGHLVVGLDFHRFYFDMAPTSTSSTPPAAPPHRNTTLCDVNVRFIGASCAVVAYVRLNQKLDAAGRPVTTQYNETRVLERSPQGAWQQVHMHRSVAN